MTQVTVILIWRIKVNTIISHLGWRIHEMELEQVLNPQGLEEKNNIGKIRPLDLRDCCHEEIILVLTLRVESEKYGII
jgi:hypothetical protein